MKTTAWGRRICSPCSKIQLEITFACAIIRPCFPNPQPILIFLSSKTRSLICLSALVFRLLFHLLGLAHETASYRSQVPLAPPPFFPYSIHVRVNLPQTKRCQYHDHCTGLNFQDLSNVNLLLPHRGANILLGLTALTAALLSNVYNVLENTEVGRKACWYSEHIWTSRIWFCSLPFTQSNVQNVRVPIFISILIIILSF